MRTWGLTIIALLSLLSCNTQKTNTLSRAYHSFTTKYNVLYHARQTFDDTRDKQIRQSQTLFTLGSSLEVLDSTCRDDYRIVLGKCEKAILSHSLRQRPLNWRQFPPQQIEYNPSIYRAWQLLAESQYYDLQIREALQSFEHIAYLYKYDLRLRSYALLWQIRCLLLLSRVSDANLLIQELNDLPSNSHKYHDKLRNISLGELAIAEAQYHEAIPKLIHSIKQERKAEVKARLYYALALCYEQEGNDLEASKCYRKTLAYTQQEHLHRQYQVAWQGRRSATDSIKQSPSVDILAQASPADSTLAPIYPIDWSRIYTDSTTSNTDSIAISKNAPLAVLDLRYRIEATQLSLSEILFLISTFTYKHYTQSSIRFRIENSEGNELRLYFYGFKREEQQSQYQQALESKLKEYNLHYQYIR